MVHVARDGGMTLRDAQVLHRLDRSGGDVHDHISSIKINLDVGDTLRARFQLVGANIGGHIECLQSRVVDLAGLLQARTALKVPHRIAKCVIPTLSRSLVLWQVTFRRKALTQPLDIFCRGISPNWLGNRSPAAQVCDPPIALSRLPRARSSIRLERRSWVVGQRGAAFVRTIPIPFTAAGCIRMRASRGAEKSGARVFRKGTFTVRAIRWAKGGVVFWLIIFDGGGRGAVKLLRFNGRNLRQEKD